MKRIKNISTITIPCKISVLNLSSNKFFCKVHLIQSGISEIIIVAYRNVESFGLFGYEHKVFNLKRAPPLSLTTFLPSISGELEELQSYNKFIPQVPWLKYSNKRKRRNIAVKQSGFLFSNVKIQDSRSSTQIHNIRLTLHLLCFTNPYCFENQLLTICDVTLKNCKQTTIVTILFRN